MEFFIKLNPNGNVVGGIERCGGHCPSHNKYAGTEFEVYPRKAYREEGVSYCTLYIKKSIGYENHRRNSRVS